MACVGSILGCIMVLFLWDGVTREVVFFGSWYGFPTPLDDLGWASWLAADRPGLARLGPRRLAPRPAARQGAVNSTSRASEPACGMRGPAIFFNTSELRQRALASKAPMGIPGVRFFSKFQSTPHDGRTDHVICTRLKEGTVQHKKDGNGWCVAFSFYRR